MCHMWPTPHGMCLSAVAWPQTSIVAPRPIVCSLDSPNFVGRRPLPTHNNTLPHNVCTEGPNFVSSLHVKIFKFGLPPPPSGSNMCKLMVYGLRLGEAGWAPTDPIWSCQFELREDTVGPVLQGWGRGSGAAVSLQFSERLLW